MKIKSFVGLVVVLVLCLGSSLSVMAAAGLSDAEETIIARLRAGTEVNGKVVAVPVSFINQAINELTSNDVDVTQAQAETIISKMDAAAAIVIREGITSAAELKRSDVIDEIIALVKEAAAVVDYTVAYDAASGIVTIMDPEGNVVFTMKNVINQTGFDITTTVMVGGLLVTLLAACVVVVCKKKFFVKTQEA